MTHLIISREYPPSTYPRGGIGTYVEHMTRLLAEHGDTVHVIAELWDGAPRAREVACGGRLIVHRVPLGEPMAGAADWRAMSRILDGMAASEFPAQTFAWQAALLAETLTEDADIDVIEAQDYEAPLYYLLLRRVLGLGPRRRPPCVVHLHSPWEFVCHANGWGLASDYDVSIKRMEDDAIAAADGWLCPSRYLARQAEAHYGLDPRRICCVPYPAGDSPLIDRAPDVWDHGSICYVGRLEPRKGVLEWIEAAVSVAAGRPGLRFEFIGADTSLAGDGQVSVRAALESRVPEPLKPCFTFSGAQPRAALWSRLAQAQLVVIPSRWENYPLTCVEAMSSGLPVLASPHGGMAEMITDAETGWIAASSAPSDLARALDRALATPAAQRAAMGRAAAAAIRRQCDNRTIVDRHRAFRSRLVEEGATRSLRLPTVPSWTPPLGEPARRETPATPVPRQRSAAAASGGLAALVLDDGGDDLEERLATLRNQTRPPASVIVVGPVDRRTTAAAGWTAYVQNASFRDVARSDWSTRSLAVASGPLGLAIVPPGVRLGSTYVEACAAALTSDDRMGLVASWWKNERGQIIVQPAPSLPYQWIADDAGSCVTVRVDALNDVAVPDDEIASTNLNDLALMLLLRGWKASTWPSSLYRRVTAPAAFDLPVRARLRRTLLARDVAAVERDWLLLHDLLRARSIADAGAVRTPRQLGRGPLSPATVLQLSRAEQWRLVRRALRRPGYAWQWIRRHVGRLARER